MLSTELPITLTAAQRNPRLVGKDGDRNLVDAVKVAASDEAHGREAMVVLNDEIYIACDIIKHVTGRLDSWGSGNLGALGLIDKRENMEFLRKIEKRGAPGALINAQEFDYTDFPDVRIVDSAVGQDGSMIEAAVQDDADGIVLTALPSGPTTFERTQADVVKEVTDDISLSVNSGIRGMVVSDPP